MRAVDLLTELEPVVAQNLDRHLRVAQEWMPHGYIPWEQGRSYTERPWEPEQSPFAPEVRAALEINLLTEDNLPSYHHEIAVRFGREGAWGTWVHRWTAEEGRHAMAIRDYLLVTRGVDPDDLERQRMATMATGYDAGDKTVARSIAYVTLQELATRVSHRNTGHKTVDPRAEALLARVATDENLHMVFYRSLVSAALEIDPSAMVKAICHEAAAFQMPGTVIPGYRRKAIAIARSGIYNLGVHLDDVLQPLLRHWKFFDLTGLDGEAERSREALADGMERLRTDADRQATRFAEHAQRQQVGAR
ncbi:acyl-ACP desaturase [Streptomyces monticola]|uniref:Acyl-ACP desaturase n=1 Tax=Streptomyces monticola TaxID=2666263 RepID=A0ABW2JRT7_9ACTN